MRYSATANGFPPVREPQGQAGSAADDPFNPFRQSDLQLGDVFRSMRMTLRASKDAIAMRLGTTTWVIDALEAGAVDLLPTWRETARVVHGYAELVHIDPEPLLRRIRGRDAGAQHNVGPQDEAYPPAGPSRIVRREAHVEPETASSRRKYALVPVLVLVLIGLMLHFWPGPLYGGARLLPAWASPAVRSALDLAVLQMAPRRDGLRWVAVGDPRLRKSDKLQTAGQ
jgi:hypothetical protein